MKLKLAMDLTDQLTEFYSKGQREKAEKLLEKHELKIREFPTLCKFGINLSRLICWITELEKEFAALIKRPFKR